MTDRAPWSATDFWTKKRMAVTQTQTSSSNAVYSHPQSLTKAGGFRFRFSSNLSWNSVVIMSSLTVAERAIGAVVGGIIADAAGKLNYCKIPDKMRELLLSLNWACLKSWPRTVILHFRGCLSMAVGQTDLKADIRALNIWPKITDSLCPFQCLSIIDLDLFSSKQ